MLVTDYLRNLHYGSVHSSEQQSGSTFSISDAHRTILIEFMILKRMHTSIETNNDLLKADSIV